LHDACCEADGARKGEDKAKGKFSGVQGSTEQRLWQHQRARREPSSEQVVKQLPRTTKEAPEHFLQAGNGDGSAEQTEADFEEAGSRHFGCELESES
jgi:hypothetical protein